MEVELQSHRTTDPLGTALRFMGQAARAAAREWTLQEHAGRLAATAGPRDYLGQLRALYNDVCRRWRYTMESGERVPGSARAVLGHVLGAAYNTGPTCPSPGRCDLARTPWRSLGWGDCDDVSTLVAAGVLALGMRPSFRVVTWPGGAHVSVLAETPRGEVVSLDPVGHPEHGFGWRASPAGGQVRVFDLDARPVDGGTMEATTLAGTHTWYADPRRGVRVATKRPHVVLVSPRDDRGARVLAVPQWVHRVMKRGLVVPRARAYDQFGQLYEYVSGLDAWAPVRVGPGPTLPCAPLSGPREERRARRERRQAKRRQALKRVGQKVKAVFAKVRKAMARVFKKISQSKIATFFRKLKTKFLRNPLVQRAIMTVLSAFGVPGKATQAIMEREASLAERGGRSALAALVAEGKWKEAAKMVGGSFVDAAKGMVKNLVPGLSKVTKAIGLSGFEAEALAGIEDTVGCRYIIEQNGQRFAAAPVLALAGVPGVYLAGQLEVSPTPESGRWYRIQPGDTLFSVVSAAYGVGPGGERLKIAKWVNASRANQCLWTDEISESEATWFGGQRISFKPRFACDADEQQRCMPGDCYGIMWLPPAAGVEPPELPEDDEPLPDVTDEPEGESEPELEDEDEVDDQDVPSAPDDPADDVPEPPPVEETAEDEPEEDDVGPIAPPDPDEPEAAPPVDDEPPAEDPEEDEEEAGAQAPGGGRGVGVGLALLLGAALLGGRA